MRDPGATTRRILALPKAELHLHLEGSLSPALLLRLAERNRLRLPLRHPEQFQAIYRYREFRDFANALLLGVACLRSPADFHDAVADLGAALLDQNVRYAEITWTPQFYLNRGFPLDELLEAMNAAARELAPRGLQLRWIPDLVRSYPAPAAQVAAWAASDRARLGGVVALGLGGPEAGHPATPLREVFERARAAGLPAIPHAGEGEGPSSIWETLHCLHPKRIGHGVRAIEDPRLVAHLAREGIPLEVSLTSNVRLGVFQSYEAHPVKQLIDAGCKVTLNTDDPILFGTSLGDEYRLAIERCGLSMTDVDNSILIAFEAAHLPEPDKSALIQEARSEIARIAAQAAC